MLGGVFAYFRLGQREDPDFTFRVMVVKTLYPGATAHEVEEQVTDRLEKKIQELPYLDYLRSYAKPGESLIFITARQDIPPKEIPTLWYLVRKKVTDIRHTCRPVSSGPSSTTSSGTRTAASMHSRAKVSAMPKIKDAADGSDNSSCGSERREGRFDRRAGRADLRRVLRQEARELGLHPQAVARRCAPRMP